MAPLKCSYCAEFYASGLHLASHIHDMHPDVSPVDRSAAVAGALRVETICSPLNIVRNFDETIPVPLSGMMPPVPVEQPQATEAVAFARVGRDMLALRTRIDELAGRVATMDAPASTTTRAVVLSEVLDLLAESGEHSAYVLVSEKLRGES